MAIRFMSAPISTRESAGHGNKVLLSGFLRKVDGHALSLSTSRANPMGFCFPHRASIRWAGLLQLAILSIHVEQLIDGHDVSIAMRGGREALFAQKRQ